MVDCARGEVLEPALRVAQDATRTATGRQGELHTAPWTPHIKLAYSNAVRPAAPVIEALGRQLPRREVAITSISLVSQAPEQMYTWHLAAEVPFGGRISI